MHGRQKILLALALARIAIAPALAGPNNGTVVNGTVTIQGQNTNSVIINQTSQNAIINWQTFNIGHGENVQILMPNSNSTELDRVIGNFGPSQINGNLTSNGRVFLVNPEGILFGQGAQVNVGSLLATTHDIANADFMAGRYNFNISGNPRASIVNQGSITAQAGGFAALVAPGVRNMGTITAWLGRVGLASANSFSLDLYGDRLIQLNVNDSIAAQVIDVSTGKPLKSLVSNEGTLKANGGRVELSAAAARQVVDSVINNSGVIEANSIGSHNGMIVLSAATANSKPAGAPAQTIKIAGKLSAAGDDPGTVGGTVVITGENIALNGARIDAFGANGGGTVLIGGDWGGGNPNKNLVSNQSAYLESYAVPHASNVTVDAATVINASATANGNGGKVILWSDVATAFYGTILARGGAQGGNGGFVETSGHTLAFTGTVDTSAANGKTGTWLLDPDDLTVDSRGALVISGGLVHNNIVVDGSNSDQGIRTPGTGNITIDAAITWTSTNTLTIDAFNNIVFTANGAISGVNGGLILSAGGTLNAFASIAVGTFNLQHGDWSQIASTLPTFSATDFIISGGSFLRVTGGDGSKGSPYQIADVYGLQGIGSSATFLASDFILANNIDASGTKNWNSGAGFVPIGQSVEFTGVFDGKGHTISDLTINQPSTFIFAGLFGVVGSSGVVENVGLLGGSVTGNFDVGALVGFNNGTVMNSYATTAVTGGGAAFDVGGLVGFNLSGATITNSYASGSVNGNGAFATGGLVGDNAGTITTSYATGPVTNGATFGFYVGGLVGTNDFSGSITQSYATGPVTGTGNGGIFVGAAGGLVGLNSGTISQSYATGPVTVDAFWTAGGLVGINGNGLTPGALITDSFANSTVFSSGIDVNLGGLVGINLPGAVVSNSQALGNVTSTANLQSNNGINCLVTSDCQFVDVGGFVGSNYGTITGTAWATRPGGCVASSSFSCAGGNVSVGSLGQGGGFAGFNQGFINFAFATGNVNGAAGLPSTSDNSGNSTQLGGFVGDNQGTISNSFAIGNVGSAGTAYLSAGGFAANNEGSITNSLATGAVLAGDFSQAGGFVGSNSPEDFGATCPACFIGDGFNNSATISNSQALGNVTVGAASIAGGFGATSGSSNGTGGNFDNVTASGAVTAGHDSIIGGLLGVVGENTTLSNSAAHNTLVVSTGPNSIIGGVVGINVGAILNTKSTAPVSGTSASYIGGIAGVNVGILNNVSADPAITGSGDHNFIGGIAGLNVGLISDSTAQVTITSDPTSYVGGVAGLNGSYANAPVTIPGSSFPNGTITNSSASGAGFSSSVGGTAPTFTPPPPSPLASCTDPICTVLFNGTLQPPNNPNNLPPDAAVPTQQISQISQIPNNTQNSTPPPILTSVDINAATGGAGTGTGGAGSNGNGSGNGNNGSLASGKQGGNGAPPGVRLIDMPRIPLPPGNGLPPLNETRFLLDRLVLQFDATLSPQQIEELLRRYGLIIEAQQTIGILGRTVYTVRIGSGQTVREVIQVMGGTGKVAPQPVYTYGLTQDGPANPQEIGDPAQYAVKKLELAEAHRISKGENVIIAVIDSAVDAEQPDFAGRVIDRYDAGCGVTAPDAHGTGMTGAIASHVQLLGVAPSAKIIAICAFGGSAGTPEATSVKIIRGLDYAVQHGAKIVNMSFAGPYDPALAQALQVAREKGVLIVAAAGNAGAKSPPLYPGADPNVMAITATDENDRLFAGANQGKYVALAAPGVNILVPAPNSGVQMTTGTSVATANVSGVAALLLAEKPSRTPEEVRAILVSTAKHLGVRGINPQFGAGLVDPVRALRNVPPVAGGKSAAAAPAARVD